MKLELDFYSALCSTSIFVINDVRADYEDFGVKDDLDKENAEPYGCGNMQFIATRPAKPEVLKKYNITKPEYELIANQLESGLSFGTCGWCV
jgi:hypothetical protein